MNLDGLEKFNLPDDRPSQSRIMELCANNYEMQELGANAEMAVKHYHPELEPGSEEFYAEVLREMGQSLL